MLVGDEDSGQFEKELVGSEGSVRNAISVYKLAAPVVAASAFLAHRDFAQRDSRTAWERHESIGVYVSR